MGEVAYEKELCKTRFSIEASGLEVMFKKKTKKIHKTVKKSITRLFYVYKKIWAPFMERCFSNPFYSLKPKSCFGRLVFEKQKIFLEKLSKIRPQTFSKAVDKRGKQKRQGKYAGTQECRRYFYGNPFLRKKIDNRF